MLTKNKDAFDEKVYKLLRVLMDLQAYTIIEISINDGFDVAEKIRKVVENTEFVQNIHLTVSIGIEEYSGEIVSELLEKADSKLYKAKNSGRNKTVI